MRHDFDFLSLVLGLGFIAVAVAAFNGWLVDFLVSPELWSAGAAVSALLIGLGAALGIIVVVVLRRRGRDRDAVHPEGVDPADGDARVDA